MTRTPAPAVRNVRAVPIRHRVPYAALLLLCMVPYVSRAQMSAPGIPDAVGADSTISQAALRFERNVNTLVWDLRAAYRIDRANWMAAIDERFIRTLIRSDRPFIRDDQTIRIGARRRILPSLHATVDVSSFIFSDERSLGLSDLAAHRALAGLAWQPADWFRLSPSAGWTLDTQQGIRDDGWSYAGVASIDRLRLGDGSLDAAASVIGEQLSPRAMGERRVTGTLVHPLGDGFNRAQVLWRESVRDFYLAMDSAVFRALGVAHPIEGRTERIAMAADQLELALGPRFQLVAGIDLAQRTVERRQRHRVASAPSPVFDTRLEEFRLGMSGTLRYADAAGRRAEFRTELAERTETYTAERFDGANEIAWLRQQRLEEGKNNGILQTQLGLSLLAPMDADTVSLALSTVKLVYDTPAAANTDDRDELFLLAGTRWARRVSAPLTVWATADVTLRHTVYISGLRSANNTWNRVFRFSPGTEYRTSGAVNRLQAEVTANYTVYDFERLNPSLTSYALRQLTVSDTVLLRVSRHIWLDVRAQLRIYERGQLFWEDFQVRPLASFDERALAASLVWDGGRVSAAAGWRHFSQVRSRHDGRDVVEEGRLDSGGPTASIRVTGDSLDIRAEGWLQRTTQSGAGSITTPNVSLGVHWMP